MLLSSFSENPLVNLLSFLVNLVICSPQIRMHFVVLLLLFPNELSRVYYIFYDMMVCTNASIKFKSFVLSLFVLIHSKMFLIGSASICFLCFILNFQGFPIIWINCCCSCTAQLHCVRERRSIIITRSMFIVLVLSCGNYWQTACHLRECRICKLLMLLLLRYKGFFFGLHQAFP